MDKSKETAFSIAQYVTGIVGVAMGHYLGWTGAWIFAILLVYYLGVYIYYRGKEDASVKRS